MGKQIQPDTQLRFGGVNTSGHPLERPAMSASKCEDFRIMRGGWLRCRGGYKPRIYVSSGYIRQIRESMVQWTDGSNTHSWRWISLSTWALGDAVSYAIPIVGTYDGHYAANNPVACCKIKELEMAYNGLGVRNGSTSKPPFNNVASVSLPGEYVGLDAYCPTANPTVSVAAGSGYNTPSAAVDIYVGLHNTHTNHYSNGVKAGTIAAQSTAATITVANLDNLTIASGSALELSYIHYVFYSTLEGGKVPYLIMNAAGTDVLMVDNDETSVTLSLVDDATETKGYYVDLTAEMPIDNFPPRPMSMVAALQGRVYGIGMDGGSGDAVLQEFPDGSKGADFKYPVENREMSGLLYSKSASDIAEQHTVGAWEHSWPLLNFTGHPSGEYPRWLHVSPDGYQLVVLTKYSSYLVAENNVGLHEWTKISTLHGVYNRTCAVETRHGIAWVTQRKELVLLESDTSVSLQAAVQAPLKWLSEPYQSLFKLKVPRWVGYWLDPETDVDQIHVYFSDGTGVVHDFVTGEGWSFTNHDFLCGASQLSTIDAMNHLLANQHIYTHLGQQSNAYQSTDGKTYTLDEDYTTTNSTVTTVIGAEYIGQWNDFGDSSQRKEFTHLDLVCDQNTLVNWYGDLEEVGSTNKKGAQGSKRAQSESDSMRRFKISKGDRFWFKFQLDLSTDGTQDYYNDTDQEGDLTSNFHGAICRGLFTVARTSNRP